MYFNKSYIDSQMFGHTYLLFFYFIFTTTVNILE